MKDEYTMFDILELCAKDIESISDEDLIYQELQHRPFLEYSDILEIAYKSITETGEIQMAIVKKKIKKSIRIIERIKAFMKEGSEKQRMTEAIFILTNMTKEPYIRQRLPMVTNYDKIIP